MPKQKKYRPKDPAEVRRNMSAIRASENRTEVALRHAIHALGLRYRKYSSELPGKPDIVFVSARVAVFVDGDYWHARDLVEGNGEALFRRLRRLSPEARRYWLKKFRRRVARDREVSDELRYAGWLVVRMWESNVRQDVQRAARRVAARVNRRVANKTSAKQFL
jgi:DNA mismatch endonuclease (patch repair protein)